MKKLFSILAVVCMGFFALALTSCGGDEEDNPSSSSVGNITLNGKDFVQPGIGKIRNRQAIEQGFIVAEWIEAYTTLTDTEESIVGGQYEFVFDIKKVKKGKLEVSYVVLRNLFRVGFVSDECDILSGYIECVALSDTEATLQLHNLTLEHSKPKEKYVLNGTLKYKIEKGTWKTYYPDED